VFRAGIGLIWEEWRQTRKLLLMVLGVLVCITLATRQLRDVGPWDAAQVYEYAWLGLLAALNIYLPLSQSTRDDIQAGVPTRRYLLPIGTFGLVFWPLMYRLVMVTALASAMCLIGDRLFGRTDARLLIACFAVAATALIHMLAWSARLLGKWISALAFFLMFFPGFALMERYLGAPILPSPWGELCLPAASILVALAATTLALKILRTGGPGYLWRKNAPSSVSAVAACAAGIEPEPFRSTLWAQVWFEWRCLGQTMTVVICCLACSLLLLLAPVFVVGMLNKTAGPWAFLANVWRLLVVFTVPVGLWAFAKRDVHARRGPGRFAHTQPLNDATLAWAKLGSSAATVLVSLTVVTLFAAAVYLFSFRTGVGLGAGDVVKGAAPTIREQCTIVCLLPLAMWIAYSRGGFVLAVVMVLGLTSEFLADNLPVVHVYLWASSASMPLALRLALIVCSGVLCSAFIRALWRGVLSKRALFALIVAWTLGTVVVSSILPWTVLTEGELHSEDMGTSALWACGAVLMLLALTPSATVALQVCRLRHR